MDIRVGVVTHTLISKKLKSDVQAKVDAAVPKNKHMQDDTAFLDDDDEMDDY